jgi:hypothetical protein
MGCGGVKLDEITAQIDRLLSEYAGLRSRSQYDDISDLKDESDAFVVRLRAALDRLVPGSNSYAKEMLAVESKPRHIRIRVYIGILRALRADVNDGWLQGVAEILHAESFDDLLDQSAELSGKGYKDASAVIAGAALESHLRLLSGKYGVSIQLPSGQPKKADVLNADLVKTGAYNNLQQKSVTAWLGIRNAAAHGEYAKYDDRQVSGMITSVRDFIARYPA